jgi:hypothetical protein
MSIRILKKFGSTNFAADMDNQGGMAVEMLILLICHNFCYRRKYIGLALEQGQTKEVVKIFNNTTS